MIKYRDIDIDEFYDRLDLKGLAVQNGQNNKPDSDSETFDAPQQRVTQEFKDVVTEARSSTREYSDSLSNQLDSIEIEIDSSRVEELPKAAEHDVENRLMTNKNIVKQLRKEEQAVERSYNAFRVTNDITREPQYVDSSYLHWSIIATLMIGEAIANSYFFALGSNLGFLGGIWKSALVSAVNIGIAVLIGTFILPYKNKITKKTNRVNFVIFNMRRLAIAGTSLAIGIILFFNLAVAHYRSQMDIDPEGAITRAIPAMLNDLLNIQSFEAWVLFILGISFSLFAGIKSYGHDDIFPGYGKIHRNLQRKKEVYQNAKEDLHDDCVEIINSYMSKIDGARSEFQRLVRSYGTVLDMAEGLQKNYKEHIKSLEGQCNTVLKKYRSHNVDVRNTASPPPKYFSETFKFDDQDYLIELPDLKKRLSKRDEYLSDLENVGKSAESARDTLRAHSRAVRNQLSLFVKEIENEVNELQEEHEKIFDDAINNNEDRDQ